jgi:hypothetical protein
MRRAAWTLLFVTLTLGALEAQRPQTGAAEIGLEDKPVVARPQDDGVVDAQSGGLTSVILIDLSRNAFV